MFFVWLGVFSTFSIAQFWSLAADVMNEAEGKRLFPLIAAGGTIGGIVGAQIAARAIRWLHPYQLMLVAAALLAVCMFLTRASHRAGLGHRTRVPNGVAKARDSRGGFPLVVRDRYLLLIAVSLLLLNLINTTGDFILAKMVDARAQLVPVEARHRFIGAFNLLALAGFALLLPRAALDEGAAPRWSPDRPVAWSDDDVARARRRRTSRISIASSSRSTRRAACPTAARVPWPCHGSAVAS